MAREAPSHPRQKQFMQACTNYFRQNANLKKHGRKIDFPSPGYLTLHMGSCYYYKCNKSSSTVFDPQGMIRGLRKSKDSLSAPGFYSGRAATQSANLFAKMPGSGQNDTSQATSLLARSPTRMLALRQEIHTETYRRALLLAGL